MRLRRRVSWEKALGDPSLTCLPQQGCLPWQMGGEVRTPVLRNASLQHVFDNAWASKLGLLCPAAQVAAHNEKEAVWA